MTITEFQCTILSTYLILYLTSCRVVYLLTVVCLIGLMLLLAEIFLFFCGKLKPINYFVVQAIQTFIWLGMLVAQVINGVEVNSEDGAPDATRSIVLGDMRCVGISTALL